MFSTLWYSRNVASATVDIQQSAKYPNPPRTLSRSSSRIFGGSEPKSEYVAEHTRTSTSSPPGSFNVVLFGETGVGKSSVLNLIARKDIAAVSSDVNGCPMQYKCYDIPFDGVNFAIYNTVALEQPQISVDEYLKAIGQVYGLINKLGASGGIHLLLFCLRGGRITPATQSNYRLFRECLGYGGVPIALVFTGLEREAEMEDWWKRNKRDIEGYGMKSDGHACITAIQDDEDDRKFLESRVRIRQLLKECAIKHDSLPPETHPWFARFARGMQDFIQGKKVPKKYQVMRVLTQRCKLDEETARRVAAVMENDDHPRIRSLSPSERAGPLVGVLNDVSVPNGRNKEDSRGTDGDDEPKSIGESMSNGHDEDLRGMSGDDESEDGREAVLREPPTNDNPPPKEHEDPQAGDGEESSEKSIDESMSNGHDQKTQQTGIEGGGKIETGEVSTNSGPLLEEYHKRGTRLPRKRRGPGERNDSSETDTPTSESPSIDLTGRVTKSSHHPFASGGCGDIYRGIYYSDEGPIDVAIKTARMYLHYDQELPRNMKRFRREAAVWWGLKHPNVLPFLGTVMDPSTNPIIPAMVCPFAENGPLTVYLQKNDMTLAKRLLLIDNVAHGLQYLHSRQIVHGDLSGSNVLIDREGTACIADFGLSTLLTRLGGPTFATNHHARGTLRWIAPELFDISDHNVIPTTQSDVYSFGCIMLQILTGKVPYHYLSNDTQVICAIVTGAKPTRPDSEVIDDNKWKFIEWCWSLVKAAKPRPSSDQIVGFTEMELANTAKRSANADSVPNENGHGNKVGASEY